MHEEIYNFHSTTVASGAFVDVCTLKAMVKVKWYSKLVFCHCEAVVSCDDNAFVNVVCSAIQMWGSMLEKLRNKTHL